MQTFTGIVQHGQRRGTALGYPTINIALDDLSITGVFAARVKLGEEWYEAAAFADPSRRVLEAHILDFSADLYGWNVTIELGKKIRENKRFADDATLKRAIAADIVSVRAIFKT